jgi:two-component system invasion response regulator UvrY
MRFVNSIPRAAASAPGETAACAVLVVDDHDEFRRSARAVVEATDAFELVAEASSGEESVELAGRLAPDLVMMDVRMPGIGGVEAAGRVRALLPHAVIVLMSVDGAAAISGPPGAHGADATMSKHALSPRSLTAIWRRHRLAR